MRVEPFRPLACSGRRPEELIKCTPYKAPRLRPQFVRQRICTGSTPMATQDGTWVRHLRPPSMLTLGCMRGSGLCASLSPQRSGYPRRAGPARPPTPCRPGSRDRPPGHEFVAWVASCPRRALRAGVLLMIRWSCDVLLSQPREQQRRDLAVRLRRRHASAGRWTRNVHHHAANLESKLEEVLCLRGKFLFGVIPAQRGGPPTP